MSGQDGSADLQSEVYNVKRKGARTVPWGAPVLDVIIEDAVEPKHNSANESNLGPAYFGSKL